jgi:sigma-B regulation protein RsbU (phosphoserine phosphatase)
MSDRLQPIVAAIESFDYATANTQLGNLAALLPVREFVGEVVLPLMRLVGDRWHDGTFTVAQEHMTSAILRNLMGGIVRLHAPSTQPVRILFATPSGELHEFGILAAALLAGASGFEPLYLGPNLPAREIVAAAERTSPKAVVLGITMSEPGPMTLEDLRLVARELSGDTELWLGGRGVTKALPAIRRARVFALEDLEELDAHLARLKGEELLLRDRAMAAAAEGIVISDPHQPDNPLIYVNDGFERLTGYSRKEVLGRNCRFLQGPGSDPTALAQIRECIRERRDCLVELLNYRKDGTPFWNRLSITPLWDAQGRLTHFVGVQSDITARKLAEERLAAANAEIRASNDRMKRDLEAAAKVQQALLPKSLPRMEGIEFAWLFKPTAELAGDQLNIMQRGDSHVALYVLDVSGHGAPSALMAVAAGLLLSRWLGRPTSGSSELSPDQTSPAAIAMLMNQEFPRENIAAHYLTLVYGLLNTNSGEFRYVAAGHPGPVLIRDKTPPTALEAPTGIPVGFFPTTYEERSLSLRPGDRLYIYSDGLVEAVNPSGEEYGTSRALSQLDKFRAFPLEESLQALWQSIVEWQCDDQSRDDVSLVALEWKKERQP